MQTGGDRHRYDVYGLGNALVDMEYRVDDAFLAKHGIAKGQMTLVDEARIDALVNDLFGLTPDQCSGGSAANTVVAVQGFGGRGYYSCKVADDETGRFFLDNLAEFGIGTNPAAAADTGKSGRCLVLVTDDAERSMNTFLGVSSTLGATEIDESALSSARIFYVEGYVSSAVGALEAASASRQLAEEHGVATAVSMSDPGIVTLFRDNLEHLLGNGVNQLFCNEEEALTWAGSDRLDIAITELKDVARTCNVTLGHRGSMTATRDRTVTVPGYGVQARDTNGAGDMYAGACLYGWAHGMDAEATARFGNFAAATLVQHYGARLRRIEQYRQAIHAFEQSREPPLPNVL